MVLIILLFVLFEDRQHQRHTSIHIEFDATLLAGNPCVPIDELRFPVVQTLPHPETTVQLLFQDYQNGIAGPYHRLFFESLSFVRITFRMFRARRNIAVSKTF